MVGRDLLGYDGRTASLPYLGRPARVHLDAALKTLIIQQQPVTSYNFSARAMLTQNKASKSQVLYQSVPPATGLVEMMTPEPLCLPRTPAFRNSAFRSPATKSKAAMVSFGETHGALAPPRRDRNDKRPRVRAVNGFFPPVKLRGVVTPDEHKVAKQPTSYTPTFGLDLAASPEMRSAQPTPKPTPHLDDSKYFTHAPVYPHLLPERPSQNGDLAYLPPPKMLISNGDIPWVYRYKVKRGMNELSKIMVTDGDNSLQSPDSDILNDTTTYE